MSAISLASRVALVTLGLALASAAPAQVVITQASALAGGVTPGDAPGFPVTLSATGSYVLGSNLFPLSVSAIQITGSNVSLDLKGFTIDGGNRCAPNGVAPAVGNSCAGVAAQTWALVDIVAPRAHVYNGSVIGSAGVGISVWGYAVTSDQTLSGHRLNDLVIAHNLALGLQEGDFGGLLRNIKVHLNGQQGAYFSPETVVENVFASRNGYEGIAGFYSLSGRRVTSVLNDGTGVYVDTGLLSLAESSSNAGDGFYGSTDLANSRASANAGNGVQYSNLAYETVLLNNGARSYIASVSGCYARLYHQSTSTLTPQVQGGTPLNGTVTTCP
jgi:hypothetical protein